MTEPFLDIEAELARIDRLRAELPSSGRVDWAAPIDLPAELARIDAARAKGNAEQARIVQLQVAPGAGPWSERHAVGIALVGCTMGVAVVAGGSLAALMWLPNAGADADPGLLMLGLGLLVLLLART